MGRSRRDLGGERVVNLLIPSVGNKRYLARRMRDAVQSRGGKLIVADIDSDAPAVEFADAFATLPPFGHAAYWSDVDAALADLDIVAVLPVREAELAGWAERADNNALDARLLLSDTPTLGCCHDKFALYRRAAEVGVDCPAWLPWSGRGDEIESLGFPAVIKPRFGAGSRDVTIARSLAELPVATQGLLAQRMVDGPEVSVDCYVDDQGIPQAFCARRRDRVVAGECIEGTVIDAPHLVAACKRLANAMLFRGIVNMQFIDSDDGPLLIDVNPRVPGGIAITEAAGYPFLDWTIQYLLNEPGSRG